MVASAAQPATIGAGSPEIAAAIGVAISASATNCGIARSATPSSETMMNAPSVQGASASSTPIVWPTPRPPANRNHGFQSPNDEKYAWPVGFQPGAELAKFWHGFKPEKGKEDAEFWPNGTAHKNRVQGNTFVQSVMFDHGIQCTNCHDMHSGKHTSMTVKDAPSNALCLTCHGPGKDHGPSEKTVVAHTHHEPFSTGSRCIECHMAKTGSNAVPGEARNHTFDFISPTDTIAQGNPNSCNTCHADKTPQWALEAVQKWWPKKK